MKFIVINAHLPNYQALAALTTYGNRADYCKRHGYTLKVQTAEFALQSCHPVSWSRFKFLHDGLCGSAFDWAWVSGTDTLNTNFNIRLEDLVDDRFHVIASCEWCSPIQADSFLVRNSEAGRAWMKFILSRFEDYKSHKWVEQQAMIDSLDQFKGIVKLLPQRAMNSYDYALYQNMYPGEERVKNGIDWQGQSGQWQAGDFLIHWPGIGLAERMALAKKYLRLVIGENQPMKETRKFGPAMEGLEDAMEIYLKLALSRFSGSKFNYMEIGVEHGRTFSAMVSILKESNEEWSATGIDVPNGPTLIVDAIKQKITEIGGVPLDVLTHIEGNVSTTRHEAALCLKDSATLLKENWTQSIHFCLIDGNHTKEGAMADFLGIEPFVPKGGIVVFHDFSERSIGEMQPECGPVNVAGACKELGLLDISNRRPGWRYAAMIMGNSDGRELGVFERV